MSTDEERQLKERLESIKPETTPREQRQQPLTKSW